MYSKFLWGINPKTYLLTLDLNDFSVKYEPIINKQRNETLTFDAKEDIIDQWLHEFVYDGGRNNELYKRAVMCADLGLDKYAIEDLLQTWNNNYCI